MSRIIVTVLVVGLAAAMGSSFLSSIYANHYSSQNTDRPELSGLGAFVVEHPWSVMAVFLLAGYFVARSISAVFEREGR